MTHPIPTAALDDRLGFIGTMIKPVRLQFRRVKGFRLQKLSRGINRLDAIKVDRSTRWGNPFRVGLGVDIAMAGKWGWKFPRPGHTCTSAEEAVSRFRYFLLCEAFTTSDVRRELRAHNLACFCGLCPAHALTGLPLGMICPDCSPCHGDPLLEIANR